MAEGNVGTIKRMLMAPVAAAPQRMTQRGLFWPDVQAAIFDPTDVQSQGMDEYNRPKWIITGQAATGDEIEIVCAVEMDETETIFITLYWEDSR
jgi:hypothetical protein